MELYFLPENAVEAMHLSTLADFGGLSGVRDEAALQASLARPRHRRHYNPDADVFEIAACYAFAFTRNHPYIDGNKRIAFHCAHAFLYLNGWILRAPQPEVVFQVLALAEGQLSEIDFAAWLRRRSVPQDQDSPPVEPT
ncbi:type II toxin-antitoxin system death-on-curing family toxin [Gloeobacter violaceus]|uniref:Glr2735 protein n=1 Tax=Gloeobacter violaceus (strain ATCC 29082 / PCC 7421) TaxID=251221 RepID=Q7NH02_GLOVI|nr:type II toxin-antitoxin system death-on-curing family toxin [Gloeobacter violaceus]BAC90676.1 glr2735 [Gloeobacter violaceus PCC 7421]